LPSLLLRALSLLHVDDPPTPTLLNHYLRRRLQPEQRAGDVNGKQSIAAPM